MKTHLALALLAALTAGTAAAAFDVGQAAIIIGEKPVRAARFGACELQHVIRLVTGRELPIVSRRPNGGCAFYVGCTAGGDASVRGKPFEREEYLIAFRGPDCYLCGNDDPDYGRFDYQDVTTLPAKTYCFRSTTYAVYDFLEKYLGVRFYGFGDTGIAFRPRSELTITSGPDVRRAPFMDAHRWPSLGGRSFREMGLSERDLRLLELRWRVNCLYGEVNHSVMGIWWRHYRPSKRPEYASLFVESRPEYFAKGYAGKNAPHTLRPHDYPDDPDLPPQLCTSDEGPVAYFADEACRIYGGEKIKGSFALRPVMPGEPYFYPVQEDDSGFFCQCERCLGNPHLADYSARHFDWVNRIARAVRVRNPKIGVGTLAYSETLCRPPDLELEDNVLVQICLGPQSWFHPLAYRRQHGAYREWVEKEGSRRPLSVWLYYLCPWAEATMVHKYDNFFPIIYPRHNGAFFREFLKDGLRGYFAEVATRYHLLEAYVGAKMSDDPTTDPERLLAEHYDLYYGAAGPAMRRFSETFEEESYNISNYTERVRSMQVMGSYIYRYHTERDNWFLGSAERVKRLDALMDAAKATAKTPLEKSRVKDYCDRIWNMAVEGRRVFEERERVRAVPIPEAVSGWVGSADGDVTRTDAEKARPLSSFCGLLNEPDVPECSARLGNDGRFLYVFYSELGDDAARHTTLSGWANGLECFFATRREGDFLQVCLSPSGVVDASRAEIVAGVQQRTSVRLPKPQTACGPSGWHLAFAVPLSAIPGSPKAGDAVYLNVFRSRTWKGGVAAAWSPIFTDGYLGGLHRLGKVWTTGETRLDAFPLDDGNWQVNLPTKSDLFACRDGILKLSGGTEKAPVVVYQRGALADVCSGNTVTFSFETRGRGKVVCGAFLMLGRDYAADWIRGDFTPTEDWRAQRVTVKIRDVNRPVTKYRPGFVAYGATVEIRNLKVVAEKEK